MPKASLSKALQEPLSVKNPHAAGIDVHSRHHVVAVPPGTPGDQVRTFGCYTPDLHDLLAWLRTCGVTTVAMESTGVYWIPLFQMLAHASIEVILVHPEYTKQAKRAKPHDVADSIWIQMLHAYGLLPASFRPDDAICRIRALWRLRATLIEESATWIQRMQKALEQMNLHLHKAITDITGKTGMLILHSIVAGQQDPAHLASFRDRRIKCSREELIKALTGDYRPEHIYALKTALEIYEFLQQRIVDCDRQVEADLKALAAQQAASATGGSPPTWSPQSTEALAATLAPSVSASTLPPVTPPASEAASPVPLPPPAPSSAPITPRGPKTSRKNCNPAVNYSQLLIQLCGVDLTQLYGISVTIALTIIMEIGLSVSAWPTELHFASWLGLSPNHRKSARKLLSRHTRKGNRRVAWAFRMAALAASKGHGPYADFYRYLRGRKGANVAITATAHRIAIDFYRLMKYGPQYMEIGRETLKKRQLDRKRRHLRRLATELDCTITENAA